MIFQNLSLTEKKLLLLFLSLLLCWWLFLAPGTASASGTYTITEAELQQLETNLGRLEQLSKTQEQESARLKEQLTRSAEQLKTLQEQLTTSTEQLKQAQNSLDNANQLLTQYANEEKRTRLRIKAQRNTWIAIASCLVIALAVK